MNGEGNSMRTEIARALHRQATDDGEVHVLWGGIAEHEDEVAEWLPFADAVLAVLAEPDEETVERATEALRQDSYAVACPPWDSLTEEQKAGWLARGRLTLRAAFGGEQE